MRHGYDQHMTAFENITAENFDQMVTKSQVPVLVDYWAPWCGPCRMIAPQLERLATMMPDILIGKLNVDEQPGLSAQAGVQGIPTLVVYQGGSEIGRMVGATSAENMQKQIQKIIQS